MSVMLKDWLARRPHTREAHVTLTKDGKWNVRLSEMLGYLNHKGEGSHEEFAAAFVQASEQHRESILDAAK